VLAKGDHPSVASTSCLEIVPWHRQRLKPNSIASHRSWWARAAHNLQ